MSSGIRMPGKKSSGSSGMRTMGARPVPAKPSIRRQPPPPASLTQRPGGPGQGNWGKGEGDGDIPLAAATGVAPPQPEVRNSVEYTLVSSRLPRTHNVMRLLSPKQVDFDAFTGPVKLRRRNKEYYRLKNKKRNEERAAALEQEMQKNRAEGLDTGAKEEVKERPKADMNLIADVGGARSNKKNLFKKRTKQVYMADEDKRRLDIEEARPWVLEDDDEKEVWTGSLEGGQSSSYVLFVLTEDGFKVVPVDRWYKFTPKLKFKTLTLDEAEEEIRRAQKNEVHDRWMMRNRLQAMDKDPEKKDDDDEGSSKAKKPKVSLVEYEVDDDIFGDDDEDEDAPRSKRAKKGDGSNKHAGIDEYDFEM
ncbi:transcription factor IIF subunit tfg1, partial [Kickxella alabastrina]